MAKHSPRKIVSSLSSGGAGNKFENDVATIYLIFLLTGKTPYGLKNSIVKHISFQQRPNRQYLDDLVVYATDSEVAKKIAIQSKIRISFSDRNKDFNEFMGDAWLTFRSENFDPTVDRLGLMIGNNPPKIDIFNRLIDIAQKNIKYEDFIKQVNTPGLFATQFRRFFELLQNKSKKIINDYSDEEFWNFLKCLVVRHLDLENNASIEMNLAKERLVDILYNPEKNVAESLYSALFNIAADYNKDGGTINLQILKNRLPQNIRFKNYPPYALDLQALSDHSDLVLSSITDNVGGYKLERKELVDKINHELRKYEVIYLSGDPMVGKSVLMKMVANQIMQLGKTISFSIDRFTEGSLDQFLKNLKVSTNFETILAVAGSSTLNCIFIDGLEKVRDHRTKQIVNDMLSKVQEHNKNYESTNIDCKSVWRVILTCRETELQRSVDDLMLHYYLEKNSIKVIKIPELTSEELDHFLTNIPKLNYIAKDGILRGLLKRPLILFLLYKYSINFAFPNIKYITESIFMNIFWKSIVMGNSRNENNFNPEGRQKILFRIATRNLSNEVLKISDIEDPNSLRGLLEDGLLYKEKGVVRFAHDVLEDWSIGIILNELDVLNFLPKEKHLLISFTRPFGLFTNSLLEYHNKPETWKTLQMNLLELGDQDAKHWSHTQIEFLINSPLLDTQLLLLENYLFENQGSLISQILFVLSTNFVQPSELIKKILNVKEENSNILIYKAQSPITEKWIPFIQLIIHSSQKFEGNSIIRLIEISNIWISSMEIKYRKELCELLYRLFKSKFKASDFYRGENKKTVRLLLKSIINASDVGTKYVQKILNLYLDESVVRWSSEFGEFLYSSYLLNPIMKAFPNKSFDILKRILIKEISSDQTENYFDLHIDLGISSLKERTPNYIQTPFLNYLTISKSLGIKLVNEVVNHATAAWKIVMKLRFQVEPIPTTFKVQEKSIEVWGDPYVYRWNIYPTKFFMPSVHLLGDPSSGPLITSALIALELWMLRMIDEGYDAETLFKEILIDSHSFAVVGVCISVALARPQVCRKAVVPLLRIPVFWRMDFIRMLNNDQISDVIKFEMKFPPLNENHHQFLKILLNRSEESFRSKSIFELIPRYLSDEDKKDIIKELENIPFIYESERNDIRLSTNLMRFNEHCIDSLTNDKLSIERGIDVNVTNDLSDTSLRPFTEVLFDDENQSKFVHWIKDLIEKNKQGVDYTFESAIEVILNSRIDSEVNRLYLVYSLRLLSLLVEDNEKLNLIGLDRLTSFISQTLNVLHSLSEEEHYFKNLTKTVVARIVTNIWKYNKSISIHDLILKLSLDDDISIRISIFSFFKYRWNKEENIIWKLIRLTKRFGHDNGLPYLNNIIPILFCIPDESLNLPNAKINSLLIDLIKLSSKKCILYLAHSSDSYYNYENHQWNQTFFELLTRYILHLKTSSYDIFINPLIKNMNRLIPMVSHFLSVFSLGGTMIPYSKNIFLSVLVNIGNRFFSYKGEFNSYYSDLESIHTALIVGGNYSLLDNDEVLQRKLMNFVKMWIDNCLISLKCFRCLIKFFYSNIQFVNFGIDYIFSFLRRIPEIGKFFAEDEGKFAIDELANLLFKYWVNFSNLIKSKYLSNYYHLVFLTLDHGNSTCNNIFRLIRQL